MMAREKRVGKVIGREEAGKKERYAWREREKGT